MPSQEQNEKIERKKKVFFKVHLTSVPETASSKTKESNFLECVEADNGDLTVDGDSADCL